MNEKIRVALKSMKIAETLLRNLQLIECPDESHKVIWNVIVGLQNGIKSIEKEVK